jgi:diadenosine tetraphosphate (Ap4A) HIT family hydrolase
MAHCRFCDRDGLDVLMQNGLAFAMRDKFPVRPLHTLVLPKRHITDTFELTPEELRDLFDLGRRVRDAMQEADTSVGGYNFGTNNGVVAGQKIAHVHFHLIPRREGEAPPPPARPDEHPTPHRA